MNAKELCKQLGWSHQETAWLNGFNHGSQEVEDLKEQVKQLKNTLIEILNHEEKILKEFIDKEKVI